MTSPLNDDDMICAAGAMGLEVAEAAALLDDVLAAVARTADALAFLDANPDDVPLVQYQMGIEHEVIAAGQALGGALRDGDGDGDEDADQGSWGLTDAQRDKLRELLIEMDGRPHGL